MIWIIFLVSTVAFFWDINSFPLRNWDEAWYAEIIKNMASGNYSLLVPFWNGQYYFDKPPLYFWLSLPFFKVFGPGEWQARIISVLAAVGASFLVYSIGKKLFNQRAGILSFLVFLTLGQIYVRFSHGNLDALLIFFFLMTFYLYLLFGKKYQILTGIFLGLGFLIKGWFLGLFPLFIIFVYSFLKEKRSPRGLILILAFSILSSGWWYLLGFLKFGKPFINWYLFTIAEGGLNIPFFSFSLKYFEYFIRDIGVWFILVFLFLIKVPELSISSRRSLFSLAIPAFIFIFLINLLNEKLDWHVLPSYPFIALLIGYITERLFRIHPKSTLCLVGGILVLQIFVVYKIENIYPGRSEAGAKLGKYSRSILKPNDVIVLDDRDFTSFLYYSNQQKVYVLRDEGPTDKRDWWILKYENLPNFLEKNEHAIIISRSIANLSIKSSTEEVIGEENGYQFIVVR